MTKIDKRPLTYTDLFNLAMRLKARNPTQFDRLLAPNEGTESLVKGLNVRWFLNSKASKFRLYYIRRNGDQELLATVYGNKRDGVMYTYYAMVLKPSTLLSAVEKHLPIHLPDGIKRGPHAQGCIYHRTRKDGSIMPVRHRLQAERRGRPMKLLNLIALNDETGEPLDELDIKMLRLESTRQNGYYDTGFFPDATDNRMDWIRSVAAMPGIDQRQTVECALRACKAAMDLTAEHPAVRMMLLPARFVSDEVPGDWPTTHPSGHHRNIAPLVHGPKATCYWLMPEVILYWHDYFEQVDGEAHWSTLSMTIPPHGNDGLDSGYEGRPGPTQLYREGHEFAYQTLVAWRPGSKIDLATRRQRTLTRNPSHYSEVVYWPVNTDKVMVKLVSDAIKPVTMTHTDIAMTPDEAAGLVHGKFVIESMPMC